MGLARFSSNQPELRSIARLTPMPNNAAPTIPKAA